MPLYSLAAIFVLKKNIFFGIRFFQTALCDHYGTGFKYDIIHVLGLYYELVLP